MIVFLSNGQIAMGSFGTVLLVMLLTSFIVIIFGIAANIIWEISRLLEVGFALLGITLVVACGYVICKLLA